MRRTSRRRRDGASLRQRRTRARPGDRSTAPRGSPIRARALRTQADRSGVLPDRRRRRHAHRRGLSFADRDALPRPHGGPRPGHAGPTTTSITGSGATTPPAWPRTGTLGSAAERPPGRPGESPAERCDLGGRPARALPGSWPMGVTLTAERALPAPPRSMRAGTFQREGPCRVHLLMGERLVSGRAVVAEPRSGTAPFPAAGSRRG